MECEAVGSNPAPLTLTLTLTVTLTVTLILTLPLTLTLTLIQPAIPQAGFIVLWCFLAMLGAIFLLYYGAQFFKLLYFRWGNMLDATRVEVCSSSTPTV